MNLIKNLSIKNKLIGLILIVTAIAMTMGLTIKLIINIENYKSDLVNQSILEANLIADFCVGPLLFNQPKSAEEILEKLDNIPTVVYSQLLDNDGDVFAKFKSYDKNIVLPRFPDNKTLSIFDGGYLHIYQPVEFEENIYGTIYLLVSTEILEEQIWNHLIISLLIGFLILVIAFFISSRLQHTISDPILKLAEFTKEASESKDFSTRIEKRRDDEIGTLYESFNYMLKQIELRNVERDKAESALRESEEKFSKIFQSTPTIVGLSDLTTGEYIEVNKTFYDKLGYTPDEVIGKIAHKLVGMDEKFRGPILEKLKEQGFVQNEETIIYCKDGTPLNVLLTAEIVEISNKKLNLTIAIDITDRKKADDNLRESEERYNLAMNATNDGIYDWNLETNEIYYSTGWKSMLGYNDDELPNDFSIWERLTEPEDVKRSWEMQQELINKKCDRFELEFKMKHKDGHWIDILSRAEAIFNEVGEAIRMVGTHTDITERKQAEELLLAKETTLQEAQRIAQLGNWELDLVENVITWSDEIYEILELDKKNVSPTYEAFSKVIHPDDLDFSHSTYLESIKNKTTYNLEFRLLMEDGRIKYVNERCESVYNDDEPIKSVGTIQDITERKNTEAYLKYLLKQLQAGIDSMPIAYILWNKNLEVIEWNKSAERIFGYEKKEMMGKNATEFIVPKESGESVKKVLESLHAGDVAEYSEKDNNITKDGRSITCKWFNIPLIDESKNVKSILTLADDISKNIQLEEEKLHLEAHLRHQQKLESIGTLAGGVAHEINNPINGIMNYAQLIKDKLEKENPLHDYSNEIILETERVAKIVQNLLTFSRDDKETHSPAKIDDIINSTVSLVQTNFKHDQIALNINIPENLPEFKCRSQQIRQVIMNLVTNAKDSLNEKYHGYNEKKIINLSVSQFERENRRWFRIIVEDRGSGISEEIQNKIYDPFFTTKDRATGTGLGLSISYGIVKDHHGELHFESEVGKYTKFYLDLPIDNGWEV